MQMASGTVMRVTIGRMCRVRHEVFEIDRPCLQLVEEVGTALASAPFPAWLARFCPGVRVMLAKQLDDGSLLSSADAGFRRRFAMPQHLLLGDAPEVLRNNL